VVEVDTNLEEPVEENKVIQVLVVMDNLLQELKQKVDLVVQVYLAQDILVETVTQEENKVLKPWMAEEVVPATSVVKVVLLMLEAAPADLDSVDNQSMSMTVAEWKTVRMELQRLKLQLCHSPLQNRKVTFQDVVKAE
jgi:hypothetical protein